MCAVPSRWRGRALRFIAVCSGLLFIDFIIGLVYFGRCADAGDACSTANEWIAGVSVLITLFLIGLIGCGLVAEAVGRHRSIGHGRDAR